MMDNGIQIVLGQPNLYKEYLDMIRKGIPIVIGQPTL